jgi:hypothetical protein
MSILNVTLKIILALESISSELAEVDWTKVGSFEAMFSLTMPDEVLLEGKAPITPRFFAMVRPHMRPRMPL